MIKKTLLQLATWGDWSVPTCPACGVKLVLRDSEVPPHTGSLEDAEYWFEEQRPRNGVSARSPSGWERKFISKNLFTRGRFSSRAARPALLLCNGRVVIASGAVLTGQVAARAIDIREGGVMDGDATVIASGEVKPASGLPARLIWGCPRYPACKLFFEVRES